MRKKLKGLGLGTRHRFKGVFARFGIRNGYKGQIETVLLKNITFKGELITDHLWFDCGKQFKDLNLQPNDEIAFDARVNIYRRSDEYNSPSNLIDYKLSNPSKIVKITKGEINNMESKKEFDIIRYKKNGKEMPIRFDYENRTVWLTQAEVAELSELSRKTITIYFKRYENNANFDLQVEKCSISIKNKKVNIYSSKYLQILKQFTKEDLINKFLDWCEEIFSSKDFEEYKLVRFTQDNLSLEVRFTNDYETAWLNQEEIAELYGVSRENVTIHIGNIFSQRELEKVSVCKFFLHTASDGKKYPVEHYNLDMILAIGYRVNSKRGIAFRKWANGILKDYLIKGYAINEKKITSLGKTVTIQNKMLSHALDIDYQELASVINEYTSALDLLDNYDHQNLEKPKGSETIYQLTYDDARGIINSMKFNQTSSLFGVEKEEGKLDGILSIIYQNVFGQEAYPSLEDKAAHLLYFLVKDHPFYDGCKRIAATLFLEFLNRNHALIKNGQLILSNDALVAITLLTAESDPNEMEIIVSVIMNLLVKNY